METIWNSGITLILFLQGLGGWLTAPMRVFTFLGNEEFFLLVAPAVYWCWDAAVGLRVGLLLMISGGVNYAVKIALHGPRPYWYDTRVVALSTETSFGIPSGHAQHAVAVWGTLANAIRRRWAWVAAIVVIFFIGLSRLYLGVHFPTDLLAGWLIGALLLWGFLKLEAPVMAWLRQQTTIGQASAALAASLILIALGALAQISLGGGVIPAEWVQNATAVMPPGEPFDPLDLSGLISNAGAFFGMAAGAIWLARRGGYSARGEWWQLLLRYLVGLVGVVVLWYGLGKVFPRGETLLPYALRYLRYALVGGWVTGLGPWLFVTLKLATLPSPTALPSAGRQ